MQVIQFADRILRLLGLREIGTKSLPMLLSFLCCIQGSGCSGELLGICLRSLIFQSDFVVFQLTDPMGQFLMALLRSIFLCGQLIQFIDFSGQLLLTGFCLG